MNTLRIVYSTIVILALLTLAGCGQTRTTGFFAGLSTSRTGTDSTYTHDQGTLYLTTVPDASDTLLNCTFDSVLDQPFGPYCPYEVYNGAMHIDNLYISSPTVLLSTAGLLDDGIVEAQFDLVDAPPQSVVGVVLAAGSTEDLLLLGVNSRGQYTIQKCMNGLWLPVMGLDAFESSRLLPYSLPGVSISAEVHGSYVDLRVNGQLIQVVRTTLPPMGQVGVFVDSYTETELDRFTVVPSS